MLMQLGERLIDLEVEWRALDLMCRRGDEIADAVGDEFIRRLRGLTDAILAATATSTMELAVQARAAQLLSRGRGESSPFVGAVERFVDAAGGIIHPPR
jgi:hypothetical protein